ncbi:MAG TPA: helical backbone metal receptor, partial [Mycobacteriales bacterium]|nr:helical backbone metal receptor [Mycobacteriales bacterium]
RRHSLGAVMLLLVLLGATGVQHLGPAPPAKIERVVTLAPSLSSTVLELGAGDTLVGVSRFDEDARVAKLPRVGGFVDPSVETIVALKPQLLVVQKAPGNRQAVEKIAELNVPVLALPLTSVSDVLDAIRELGTALGRSEKAREMIDAIESTRARMRELAKKDARHPRVLMIYGFKPLVVAGQGGFADELLADLGAVNVAGKARSAYPVFSLERALALQADVVVDCSDVADGRDDTRALLKKPRWVLMPSRALLQPGPSLGRGLEELRKVVFGGP